MWHAAWMFRGSPPGESGHSKIEAPPEKMDRATFAAKIGSEFLENAIALQKNTPKPVRIFGVVGGILLILFERNGGIDFVRRRVDLDRYVESTQGAHHFPIK